MPGVDSSSNQTPVQAQALTEAVTGSATTQRTTVALAEHAEIRALPIFGDVHETESLSRHILETVGEGIYCLDLDGLATFVNPAAARMLGWKVEELIGRPQHTVVHHSYPNGTPYPVELCPIQAAITTGVAHHSEEDVFWRKDGTSFQVSYTSTPIKIGGAVAGLVVVFRDISLKMRRQRWQSGKDAVLQAVTSHQPLDDTLQLLSDAYTNYQPGCSIAILLRADEASNSLALAASSALSATLKMQLQLVSIERNISACGHAASAGEEVVAESDGRDYATPCFLETLGSKPQRCVALPMISSGGRVLGVVAFLAPIDALPKISAVDGNLAVVPAVAVETAEHIEFRRVRDLAQIALEHRNLQYELVHQSHHDRLTGLPNWLLVEDRLKQLLWNADRAKTRIAVCAIDIDRFRRVNENFGHLVGDELLQQIAKRFKSILRGVDTLARQGGDEFIVLLPDVRDASEAEAICRRLLNTLDEPFVVDRHSMTVAANIGISIYPDHAAKPELLIQHADTALDSAKEGGEAKIELFRPDLGEKVRQLAARESALRTALERDELYLMYQPLYKSDRKIHGFEALLRWRHPELGLIPPDQFIPLAEETGLILPIGDWVLAEACRQAMEWKPKGLADTKIFVNISARQLGQTDFTKSVSCALRSSGLPPSRLELEVTESFIVPSFQEATARLQPLQNLGVSIAIDDFGTGHSSFSVLHKLPINAIKVDRSFISRIDNDPAGLSTVRAIVSLAQELGMKTVGEGIETEAQFDLLNDMKCDYFQGFLLSKPLSAEDVQLLFAESSAATTIDAIDFRRSA